jgi:lectin, mannose-binding 2
MLQARGLRGASIPTKAKLTYFQDKSLKLQLQYKSEEVWIDCFDLEPTAQQPLKMPSTAYLSFSAETGELSDNFDIVSVETRNVYNPVGSSTGTGKNTGQQSRGGRGRRERKSGGGWGWFFMKIIMFIIVAGGAYVGYTYYRMKQRERF